MPSLFLLLGRWSFCCSSPHFRGSEVVMKLKSLGKCRIFANFVITEIQKKITWTPYFLEFPKSQWQKFRSLNTSSLCSQKHFLVDIRSYRCHILKLTMGQHALSNGSSEFENLYCLLFVPIAAYSCQSQECGQWFQRKKESQDTHLTQYLPILFWII